MRGSHHRRKLGCVSSADVVLPLSSPTGNESLVSLAPQYVEARHGTYADALENAIREGSVTNVALAGAYGSGKSSILREIVRRFPRQVVEVALAPLPSDPAETRDAEAELMQKEIVKQILYVLDPSRATASRFPRVSRERLWRSAMWAVGAGVVGVALQSLIAIGVVLVGDKALAFDPGLSLGTFAAVAVLTFTSRRLSGGRWTIRDIKAGPTALTLSEDSPTYFDQYLDEIVYFFQVSKNRIVIFEDMDRFPSTDIFVSLRALNKLLNNAAQLKPQRIFTPFDKASSAWRRWRSKLVPVTDGPVIFVYAVRDSLIPLPGESSKSRADVDQFARTKFFDLIIPVVPFVTPRNARDALHKEFATLGSHGVSSPLLQSVAQHFPDMRQLRNIRNEFDVYSKRLLLPGRSLDQLNADRLFALIAYKNANPEDFELIRLGSSRLDTTRQFAADLIFQHLARVRDSLLLPHAERQRQLAASFGESLVKKCTLLGVTLYRDDSGQELTEAELKSVDVLTEVSSGRLRIASSGATTTVLSPSDLESLTGMPLGFAHEVAPETSEREVAQLREELQSLEHMTWERLYDSPRYTYVSEDDDDRFSEWTGANFADFVDGTFGEGLVPALISRGQLNRDFALLITEYSGQHISVEARNFLDTVLENPIRTTDRMVSETDILQILEEQTEDVLSRAGMVNVSVLRYLLSHRPEAASRIVKQLVQLDDDDTAFLDLFLRSAPIPPAPSEMDLTLEIRLIAMIATDAVGTLDYIVGTGVLSDDARLELFGSALGSVHLPSLTTAALLRATREYAVSHHARLSVLREDSDASANAVAALNRLGTQIAEVAVLSPRARRTAVEINAFQMTEANLRELTDSPPGSALTLDWLHREHGNVFVSVASRVEEYLDLILEGDYFAVQSSAGLVDVLNSIADRYTSREDGEPILEEVARRSPSTATVEDVEGLSASVRDALFRSARAVSSMHNLSVVISETGALSVSAGRLLAHSRRVNFSDESESDRLALANQIVSLTSTHETLLDAQCVVEVISSLKLIHSLDAGHVSRAPASVATALTRAGFIDVLKISGMVGPKTPWELREAILEQHPTAAWGLRYPLVTSADVPAFLANADVAVKGRAQALDQVPSLLDAAESEATAAADALARFAAENSAAVTADDLIRLAGQVSSPTDVLRILIEDDSHEAWRHIVVLLIELGGPYRAITDLQRPSPRFARDEIHQRFLERLRQLGYLRAVIPREHALAVQRLAS